MHQKEAELRQGGGPAGAGASRGETVLQSAGYPWTHAREAGGPPHGQGHLPERHPKERHLLRVQGGSGEPRFPTLLLTATSGEGDVNLTRQAHLPPPTGSATADRRSWATLVMVGPRQDPLHPQPDSCLWIENQN